MPAISAKTLAIFIVVLIAVAGIAAFVGYQYGLSVGGGAAAKKRYKIGLVLKTLTNPYFIEMQKEFLRLSEKLGFEARVLSTATEQEVEKQVSMVEDLIAWGADAILITPDDSAGIVPAFKACREHGVICIAIDTPVEGDSPDNVVLADFFIGPDFVDAGEKVVDYVAKLLSPDDPSKAEGKIAIFLGVPGAGSTILKLKGIRKGLSKYPGLEVVFNQTGMYERARGASLAEDLLSAHPDVVVIISQNDLMALGALERLKALKRMDIIVTGMDAIPEACMSLLRGELKATINQRGADQVREAIYAAYKLLAGVELDKKWVDLPAELITKENVVMRIEKLKELGMWSS
ncbi:MAG: hypothetical protein DRO15_04155 [Thermoprotei archaeon]|nr:MAG: hypothetical protein DRO15_04155 [Thermoprotei archaeon]